MDDIPVTRSFLPPLDEYIDTIRPLWESHWLTNQGALHKEFEAKLKAFLDVDNVTLFTNGHLALDIAIRGLALTGEVITTPFTFASTAHAITMNGLRPVFCDIKLQDYTIDESKIESLITEKTSAILPVHVYGNPCAVESIKKIAKKYNLKVIYDAAHAFGVTYKGISISSFGDIAMFSFHATKVFHSIEGGALVYHDKDLKRTFDLLKNFGISGYETVETPGLNAKMNEFQAAMGIINLRYLESEIAKRKNITELYNKYLTGIDGISINRVSSDTGSNYAYYPVRVDALKYGKNRDQLFDLLAQNNIHARKYFYPLISDFNCYKTHYSSSDTPAAQQCAQEVLTLPLYGSLTETDISRICGVISDLAGSGNG